jgi:hypothetical protein
MKIGTLNVITRTFTERAINRKKTLTEILIRMGDTVIADRTIPGAWDQKAALTEFKRFPERFKPRDGYTTEVLKAIAA